MRERWHWEQMRDVALLINKLPMRAEKYANLDGGVGCSISRCEIFSLLDGKPRPPPHRKVGTKSHHASRGSLSRWSQHAQIHIGSPNVVYYYYYYYHYWWSKLKTQMCSRHMLRWLPRMSEWGLRIDEEWGWIEKVEVVGTYVHDRCRIVHRVRKKANIMLHASNGGKKGGGVR